MCKRVQCDEIWSFVGAKSRSVKAGAQGAGDVYTWTAMDADSKLMISWLVGRRSPQSAREFIRDLHTRLATRVQITTDGYRAIRLCYREHVRVERGGLRADREDLRLPAQRCR